MVQNEFWSALKENRSADGKEEGNDQESIQASTTSDPRHHMPNFCSY